MEEAGFSSVFTAILLIVGSSIGGFLIVYVAIIGYSRWTNRASESDYVAHLHGLKREDIEDESLEKAKWLCGVCRFANIKENESCMLCETKRGILLDVFASDPSPTDAHVIQYEQLNSLQAGAVPRKQWHRGIDIAGRAFWKATDVVVGPNYVIESEYACAEMNLVINQLTDASAGKTLQGELLPLWWFRQLKTLVDLNFSLKYAWLLGQISSLHMKYAQLKVYRDKIFDESLCILLHMEPENLCTLTRVTMLGESGVDAGGIQREWYTVLTIAIFEPARGLFVLENKKENAYFLNPNSAIDYGRDHLLCFQAVGRLLGRAILDGQVLPFRLCLPLFKAILGTPLSMEDVRHIDEATYNSLVYLQD
ncbi:HECT E3 ubiquitin ligase, partial [Achlya hypogyna]